MKKKQTQLAEFAAYAKCVKEYEVNIPTYSQSFSYIKSLFEVCVLRKNTDE